MIYIALIMFIFMLQGFLLAVINNLWIELLIMPFVVGGLGGFLFGKLQEIIELDVIKFIAKRMAYHDVRQSEETME